MAAALAAVAGVIVAVVVSRPGSAPGTPAAPVTAPVAAPPVPGPKRATIPDPATADPCSLLDIAPLQSFGTASLDPDNVSFAGCRADIQQADGGAAGVTVTFENEIEVGQVSGGTRTEAAGYTIITYEPGESWCERRILLDDRNAILVSAVRYEDPAGSMDLCTIADVGRINALTRLVQSGIGRRPPLVDTSPLAGIPACTLLFSEDIATAISNSTPARPRFGDWGCKWNSFTSSDSVEVTYYRGYPLGAADGTPATFAGHPGTVLPREGNCWVQFVQRGYTAGGNSRIEAVWVTYWGSGTGDQLCRTATTLATAAAGRLPPPS